ncbi:MAG: DUF4405 domain-containing protein [Candidatus Omnitrophica bacterium]|nr:DUF4405 domain-containing protein [Candidatus Omnitrophota bacterium]
MKRSFLNIIVDAVSLIAFSAMISTGFILKYILPPGSGRVERLVRGGGRFGRTIDTYLGATRHEWGEIHFYIALAFLFLLILHLVLHWHWIKAVTFGTKEAPVPRKRKIITICIILWLLMAFFFPWIAKKKTFTRTEFMQLRKIEIQRIK